SSPKAFLSDDTNDDYDVFLYDREEELLTRISSNAQGEAGNGASGYFAGLGPNASLRPVTISDDGSTVAFLSIATDLGFGPGQIYLYDVATGELELGSTPDGTTPANTI